MNENKNYQINHLDGRRTIFGPTKESASIINEAELVKIIEQLPLPILPSKIEIIGFGGRSVSLRLVLTSPNTKDEVALVGVIRYIDEKENKLPEKPTSKLLHSIFEEYCVPEWSIVIGDQAGKRLSIKFAPEVKGGTLKDLSPLHLISNPTALHKFAQFCHLVTQNFAEQGWLPDLVGHSQRGTSFFPFFSSNLMIEYGTNTVKLIDTDILDDNDRRKTSLKRKFVLLMRMLMIFATGQSSELLSKIMKQQHIDGSPSTIENELVFISNIQKVITVLEQNNINYRVVGGLGVAGHLMTAGTEYHFSSQRSDGSVRDIDILVLDIDPELLEHLQETFATLKKVDPSFPEVSITSPNKPKRDKTLLERVLPRESSRLVLSNERVLMQTYGNLSQEITESDLKPVRVEYNGVSFNTIAPEVLFGLALTRNGVIRFKDLAKYELFLQTFKIEIDPKFLNFAQQIRTQERDMYRNFLVRQWLSIITKGIFDGALTKRITNNN